MKKQKKTPQPTVPAGRGLPALLLAAVLAATSLSACAAPAATSAAAGTTATTPGSAAASSETGTLANGSIQLISPENARILLDENPAAVLIDVRTEEEYLAGHIPGSLLLPVDELADRLNELPPDKQTILIVYCRTGRRSAIAALILLEAGYLAIYDLGGIADWPYETEAG